jgi:hypothetical protein
MSSLINTFSITIPLFYVVKKALTTVTNTLNKSSQSKVNESIFYFTWHTLSTITNVTLLLNTAWFTTAVSNLDMYKSLCENFRTHSISINELCFYECTLSFWCCSVLFLVTDARRKDFAQMAVHHAATVTLVALSLNLGFWRFGQVVLLLHDVVDVFLYAAKTLHYLDYIYMAEKMFTFFAFMFFACRLVFFPICAVWPAWQCAAAELADGLLPGEHVGLVLPGLLTVLWVLHVFWFWLIVKMAVKMMLSGDLGGDARSEDDKVD